MLFDKQEFFNGIYSFLIVMKAISFLKRLAGIISPAKLSFALFLLVALSCQKDELDRNLLRTGEIAPVSTSVDAGLTSFFAEETFTITSKDAISETRVLADPGYFEKLFIHVQNGNSGNTKVTKMEILIDGVTVVTYADFRKNVNTVQKEVKDLKKGSVLKVRIDGSKGRFIKIKIYGKLKDDVISDIEGNFYHTVKIGDTWWMSENLKTTELKDGTPVPNWIDWGPGGYCYYNNDPGYKDTYGAIYSENIVKSGNLCPTGWHVPNNSEWSYITEFLGGPTEAGGKLKEAGTAHWSPPNTGATNESGFTALPGGYRDHIAYNELGKTGFFWSVSKCGGTSDCGWGIAFSSDIMSWSDRNASVGYSVRCIKGEEPMVPEVQTWSKWYLTIYYVNSTEAYPGVSVLNDHGYPVFQKGVCWSTNPLPTISDNHTVNGVGLITGLIPGAKYYVRAYATSSAGTGYSMSISFTTLTEAEPVKIDVDGNRYETVLIGSQVWMKSNLHTSVLNDGLPMQLITDDNLAWWNSTVPAYCFHPQNEYQGTIYNWQTVNTGKICPQGWHVPSNADWTNLTNYLVTHGYNYDGTFQGDKSAKALSAEFMWKSSVNPGTPGNTDYPEKVNASGFSAIPGGTRGISFSNIYNESANFWSSSPANLTGSFFSIYYNQVNGSLNQSSDKQGGYSVRCLKNE